jgi:Effector-associated domain 1/TIR domain
MSLSGKQLKEFQNALLAAFSPQSLKQMVRTEMEENLDAIVGGGNFMQIVFELIAWAEQYGRTEELIEAAYRANSGNPLLKAFYQEFTKSSANVASGQTPPPSGSNSNTAPPDTPTAKRTKVFISYSHKDREYLDRLQVHLKPLERAGIVERWDDTMIQPGQRWKEEIEKALAEAKVAVLLISPDFLNSDFIADSELPPIFAAEAEGKDGPIVLPVIVRPSLFHLEKSLSQIQAVNEPSRPLIKLTDGEQDEVFVKLAETIYKILKPVSS